MMLKLFKLMTVLILVMLSVPQPAAARGCPNYNLMGERHDYSGSELYSRETFSVRAGGNINVRDCRISWGSDRGSGYVTERPDFSIMLSGMERYDLHINAVSECDAVLVVNTGKRNWYYDDDDHPSSPLDPQIILTNPSNGWLDVWVGTLNGETCDATLSLETF